MPSPNFYKSNLAAAEISSAIGISDTTITITPAEAAIFPTAPFHATIMPSSGTPNMLNSEIVEVSAVNTTTGALTVVRAQRGTTAKAFSVNAVIMVGVYSEDAVFLSTDGTPESASPWIQTSDITNGAITSEKIADGAVGTKMVTTVNLAPANDTPTAWIALLGQGEYTTQYNSTVFTRQPATYGSMENTVVGTRITQTFVAADGIMYIRTGGSTGWYGTSGDPGVFRVCEENVYSLGEKRIGTYLGKPLYRSVVKITDPQSTNQTYDQFTTGTVDHLVRLSGEMKTTVGTAFPVPLSDSNSSYAVVFITGGNKIRGRFSPGGGTLDTNSVYIVVEFTKVGE